jgi:hypothetical protein
MPHDHMIMSLKECEDATLIPGKNTGIIATSSGPLQLLMTTIFSLLLRSNPNHLEHFMVCINGPDERCGDPTPQDKKQKFLEELRKLKWGKKDMPITVIRAWSRVGHSQALEMAIPWVHTEYYTIIHDDIIVTDNEWCEESFNIFQDKNVAIIQTLPMTYGSWGEYIHEDKRFIGTHHINSTFVVCKKSILTQLGTKWCGYHIVKDYNMSDLDYDEFQSFYDTQKSHGEIPKKDESYGGLSFDIGSWMLYQIKKNNYKVMRFHKNPTVHFVSASWTTEENYLEKKINENKQIFYDLEKDLESYPEFNSLYKKYKNQ